MRKNFSYKAVSSLSLLFLFGTLVYPHLPTRAETGAFSSESITGSTLAADEATTIAFEKDLRKPSLPRWIPGILGERLTRLAIDAVENALTAGEKIPASSLIPSFALNQLSPKEAVRWYRLGGFAKEETFLSLMENAPAEPALLYHLELAGKLGTGNRAQRILHRIRSALPKEYETYRALTQKPFLPPSAQEIRSLFYDYPNISKFQNGAFLEKPRLFLFCRHDRNYPCLLLMKDRKDQVARTSSGKIGRAHV